MKNNKNGLDEMQREKRNSIGNQMFILTFYALLFDVGLYGAGIRWIEYPLNTMIIIIVCMTIYLIRTIAASAYLPPKAQNRKTIISIIIAIAFSILLVKTSFILFGNKSTQPIIENTDSSYALLLFIIAGVGLLISLIVAIIKRVNDRKNDDD